MDTEDICKLCGSKDVGKEDCDGCLQIICKKCGYVDENEAAMFTTTDQIVVEGSSRVNTNHHYTSVPKGFDGFIPDYNDHMPRKEKLKRSSQYPIDSLCSALGLQSSSLIEEIWDLFTRVYEHDAFRCTKYVRKSHLSVACVLIVCSNHGYPTSLLQMSNFTGIHIEDIGTAKKDIIRHLEIQCRYVDIEELVTPMGTELRLSKKIIDTAVQIIQLCKDVCLTASCIKESIIISALFISWQWDGLPATAKQTLKKFSSKFRIKYSTSAFRRLKEMREVLIKLCSKIPWLEDSVVSEENFLYHLDDILNHRSVLMAEYKNTYMSKARASEENEIKVNKNINEGCQSQDTSECGQARAVSDSGECTFIVKDAAASETILASAKKRDIHQVDQVEQVQWFKRRGHMKFK